MHEPTNVVSLWRSLDAEGSRHSSSFSQPVSQIILLWEAGVSHSMELSLHSFLPIIFAVCHHGVESVVCHYDFVYVCTVKFGLYFSKMFMKSVVSFE